MSPHPGRVLTQAVVQHLERVIDLGNKAGLWLLTRYVTPAEIRRAGSARLSAHLHKAGRVRKTVVQDPVDAALAAAREQRTTVPGESTAADLIREMASEALQGPGQTHGSGRTHRRRARPPP